MTNFEQAMTIHADPQQAGGNKAASAPPWSDAQILLVLGAAGYQRQRERDLPLGMATSSLFAFDAIVALAKRRGFKQRRQLLGCARRGSGTSFAIDKAAAACSFLTRDELGSEFARAARWVDIMRGRP